VRVLAHRQVQRRVGRVQVGAAATPVGQPGDSHLTDHRGQPTLVIGLDCTAGHALGVDDVVATDLAQRPQVQVILEQLPHQLPCHRFEEVVGFLGGDGAGGLTHAELEDQLATRGSLDPLRRFRRLERRPPSLTAVAW
jgi:hypothetical protein